MIKLKNYFIFLMFNLLFFSHKTFSPGPKNFINAFMGGDLEEKNSLLVTKGGFVELCKSKKSKSNNKKSIFKAGLEPIHIACLLGRLEIVQDFIKNKKVEISITNNKNGFMPIHYACKYGKLDIVKFLVKSGANINSRNNNGESAILVAAKNANIEVMIYLLHEGANINDIDSFGNSSLFYICADDFCSLEVIEYFVELGANINNRCCKASFEKNNCLTNIGEYLSKIFKLDVSSSKINFLLKEIQGKNKFETRDFVLMFIRRHLYKLNNTEEDTYCSLLEDLYKEINSAKSLKEKVIESFALKNNYCVHDFKEYFLGIVTKEVAESNLAINNKKKIKEKLLLKFNNL